MAVPTAKITDTLMLLAPDEGRARLEAIDKWTRGERIAETLLPSLMSAATTSYTIKGGALPKAGLVTGQKLVDGLRDIHARTYAILFPGEPFECTPTSISNFKTRGYQSTAFPLAALFLLWLSEQIAAKRVLAASRVHAILSIFNFVRAVEEWITDKIEMPRLNAGTPQDPLLAAHQVPPTREAELVAEDERNVSRSFGRLIGLERLAPEVIETDFFTNNPSQASFVLYRRSTNNNDIIKGFLVIQPPKTGNDDAFSFNHFYADGLGNDRETRGFVLSLAGRHYFIGATGNLHSGRPSEQTKRPLLNEGMKFLVVDRKMQAQKSSMWGALFLSNDGQFMPIAGRCILIRSKFDHSRDVKLGAVHGDLHTDIETYCHVEPGLLEKHKDGILRAIDNSFEPRRAKGGDQSLMGPLTIVPPIA